MHKLIASICVLSFLGAGQGFAQSSVATGNIAVYLHIEAQQESTQKLVRRHLAQELENVSKLKIAKDKGQADFGLNLVIERNARDLGYKEGYTFAVAVVDYRPDYSPGLPIFQKLFLKLGDNNLRSMCRELRQDLDRKWIIPLKTARLYES